MDVGKPPKASFSATATATACCCRHFVSSSSFLPGRSNKKRLQVILIILVIYYLCSSIFSPSSWINNNISAIQLFWTAEQQQQQQQQQQQSGDDNDDDDRTTKKKNVTVHSFNDHHLHHQRTTRMENINTIYYCMEHRGESGRWIQDWEYANSTTINYPNHGSYSDWHIAQQKFQSTPEQPFRLATSWIWQDDTSSTSTSTRTRTASTSTTSTTTPTITTCPSMRLTNQIEFCMSCHKLQINRILILGDSLSIEFFRSITSMLGYPLREPFVSTLTGHQKPVYITCPPPYSTTNITIQVFRTSPVTDWYRLAQDAHKTIQMEEAYYHQLQQPQLLRLLRPPPPPPPPPKNRIRWYITGRNANDILYKTAIVANLGAWIHSIEDYQKGFDSFLTWLDSFDQDTIIPFFRETIPGHLNCQPNTGTTMTFTNSTANTTTTTIDGGGGGGNSTNSNNNAMNITTFDWVHRPVYEIPYSSYREYQTDLITLRNSTNASYYNWGMFEAYNQYAKQRIQSLTAETTTTTSTGTRTTTSNTIIGGGGGAQSSSSQTRKTRRTKIHWLNVYNSSILRRDGHIGFGDCLHYYLPGPPDWWVHFFHNALVDLATIRELEEEQMNE